jgi:hypothetical protein
MAEAAPPTAQVEQCQLALRLSALDALTLTMTGA